MFGDDNSASGTGTGNVVVGDRNRATAPSPATSWLVTTIASGTGTGKGGVVVGDRNGDGFASGNIVFGDDNKAPGTGSGNLVVGDRNNAEATGPATSSSVTTTARPAPFRQSGGWRPQFSRAGFASGNAVFGDDNNAMGTGSGNVVVGDRNDADATAELAISSSATTTGGRHLVGQPRSRRPQFGGRIRLWQHRDW